MEKSKQYLFYIFFAVISTVLNLIIQFSIEYLLLLSNIVFFQMIIYKNISLVIIIKMFAATIAAFIFKFAIDKLVIFKDRSGNIAENIRQIHLYGFFAIFTTLIFWGTELSFKYFFPYRYAEYTGAVIGLAAGYTIKFFLDKKFVFNRTG